jgi:hypothetical protein
LDGTAQDKSIGFASTLTGSGTNAYLNLPPTHYTLMNDRDVELNSTKITVTNINSLGTDAVFGINQQIDVDISTNNTNGGTILIGAATTDVSQGHMTITAPTSGTLSAGNPKSFAASVVAGSQTSYLGYKLPRWGTGNLGNYGNHTLTVLDDITLPMTLAGGGVQIYNHSRDQFPLDFNKYYESNVDGAGNLLIESYGELNLNAAQKYAAPSSGNVTLNGGQVNMVSSPPPSGGPTHSYTGSGSGDYGMYAFKSHNVPVWDLLYTPDPALCGQEETFYTWTNPENQTENNYQYDGSYDNTGFNGSSGSIIVAAGQTVAVTHSGSGSLRWEATHNIETADDAAITFTHTNSGHINWQAKDSILAGGDITFNRSGTGNAFWQAEDGSIVTLPPTSKKVFFDINGSADTVAWQAGKTIRTENEIDFQIAGQTNSVAWQAGDSIWTKYKTTFDNQSDHANILWYAQDFIKTQGGVNGGTTIADSGVTFTQGNSATGKTLWWAERGDIITDNAIHFNHSAASNGGNISWWAGRNIILGEAINPLQPSLKPVLFDYASNDTIEWHSKNGYILTHSQVDINRINTGAGRTFLHAGCATFGLANDIRIENVFNYTEDPGAGAGSTVEWYAENDILSNVVCDDDRPAPITFRVGAASKTSTLWEAERNINTKGRADFFYGEASGAGPLVWLSRAGYIQTERPVNIFYQSDSLISLRAENEFKNLPLHPDVVNHANSSGRRGNIHTFDSLTIVRTNGASGVGGDNGLTEILAENHIWTAMVNYEDRYSSADTLNIISHYGDIYLGLNDGVGTPFVNPYYVSPVMQENPSASCPFPVESPIAYDLNRFTYRVNAANTKGQLNILAGFADAANADPYKSGGNIYFTHKDILLEKGSDHDTKIAIPFTNWYMCGDDTHGTHGYYEQAGIIGGVGRCALNGGQPQPGNTTCVDTGLIYRGYDGDLSVDAGTRGNIIINNGASLSFQAGAGNADFLTRWGDIDMRYPFDADSMQGGLLFLASSDLNDKRDHNCDCDEWRNNVYLQDFRYTARSSGGGSVYVGADNNIKLQYGGLRNIGTMRDPFISENSGYPCGSNFHCDADTSVNRARPLELNFRDDPSGGGVPGGGFAAVASDLIDVYRDMIYTGGAGTGMKPVPGYGTLHGEPVAGYGLYIKTQGDKRNWTKTDFAVNNDPSPTMGAACDDDACQKSYLHNTARVTFHADARVRSEGQRSLILSPTLETFGSLELNTSQNAVAGRTGITVRTDSLICHDSLIIDGPHTTLGSWSQLYRGVPVIKLGHHRFTPPVAETSPNGLGGACSTCYTHTLDPARQRDAFAPLDTVTVTVRNDGSIPRLHTLVADHALVTFLTDSFDHVRGNPTLDAKIFTDTFRIRNHVEMIRNTSAQASSATHNAHFELVSEEQMHSKDYAGVYARHLHMEPVGPACSAFGYSQLWLIEPTLNVITTSQFGGFGWLHNDVYVEIDAVIAPGYASLERKGNCYEQHAGILRTKDLRMDKGAKLKFSIGDNRANAFTESYRCENGRQYTLGEYADLLDVDSLTVRDRVFIDIAIRPEGLDLGAGETRCFPILRYKATGRDNLKHLKLSKNYLSSDDHPSINGRYYMVFDIDEECQVVSVCIQPVITPIINRRVEIPFLPGVSSDPEPGIHFVPSHTSFFFSLKFGTPEPLAVRTGRIVEGVPEPELKGTPNDQGGYEYILRYVREDVLLQIGPDAAATSVDLPAAGTAVWSHRTTLYIRTEQENQARIYSIAGQLVRQLELPEGIASVPLPPGVYIVVLEDGRRHKVVIR